MIFYFFCYPHGPVGKAGYEHEIVALAEGLKELNVKIFGNVNYWSASPGSNDYLINDRPEVDFEKCDVVVFSSVIYNYERLDLLPKNLFCDRRKYKLIFIDSSDGLITPGYKDEIRKADLVLKTHYCHKNNYPENFRPWQFGLTNRIINASKPLPYSARNNDAIVNFRVKHHLRDLAEQKVMHNVYEMLERNTTTNSFDYSKLSNFDRHYWNLTGRRHYPDYYERLGKSKVCAAFGGILGNSKIQKSDPISKILGKLNRYFNFYEYDCIAQFDSWRFWESMVSGCVTLHVDFEKYGAVLPVMPENEIHYLGINFSDLNDASRKLKAVDRYEFIGNHARKWALKYYSPRAVAERLLNLL
jgi:hypothetical protein